VRSNRELELIGLLRSVPKKLGATSASPGGGGPNAINRDEESAVDRQSLSE